MRPSLLRWSAALAVTLPTLAGCSTSGSRAAADAGASETGGPTEAGPASGADARGSDAQGDAEPADAEPEGDAGGPSDAGRAPPPSGGPTASSTATLFAVHDLWLGDTLADPSFSPDPTGSAWANFGYNIDGLITTQYSTDVCTPDTAAGATRAQQVDGVDGIDNSFGKNIIPLLASALPNLSQTVSAAIVGGSFNVLIGAVGLTSSPTQTNRGLTGTIFNGAPYAGAPPLTDAGSFAPTDEWPITSDSVKGSLEAGAVESFPDAYVADGVWVNGSPGDLTLVLSLQGQPLVLRVHQALVSFVHTVDASGQHHATKGVISGVLKTTEFLAEVNVVAAQQDYCAEASLLLNAMAASSDVLSDGTNAPGKPCDGISIGISFDADGIAPPSTVVPSIDAGAPPKGCVPDAGGP